MEIQRLSLDFYLLLYPLFGYIDLRIEPPKNNQTNMLKFLKDLFNDNNDINEKSVVGFLSFLVMVAAMIVDLITGFLGKELLINKFIFDGFLIITLGSFGIAAVDKWVTKRADNDRHKSNLEAGLNPGDQSNQEESEDSSPEEQ